MKTIFVLFIIGVITLGSTSGAPGFDDEMGGKPDGSIRQHRADFRGNDGNEQNPDDIRFRKDADSNERNDSPLLDFIIEAYRQRDVVIRNAAKFFNQNGNTIFPLFKEGLQRFQDAESIKFSTESLKAYFGDLLQDRFNKYEISKVIDSLDSDEDGFVDLQELGAALAQVVKENQDFIKTVLENFHLDGYLKRFFRRYGAAIQKFISKIPSFDHIMSDIRDIAKQRGIKIENLKSYLPILRELVRENGKSVIEAITSSLENLPKLIDMVPEALNFIEKNGNDIAKGVGKTVENLRELPVSEAFQKTIKEILNKAPKGKVEYYMQ